MVKDSAHLVILDVEFWKLNEQWAWLPFQLKQANRGQQHVNNWKGLQHYTEANATNKIQLSSFIDIFISSAAQVDSRGPNLDFVGI